MSIEEHGIRHRRLEGYALTLEELHRPDPPAKRTPPYRLLGWRDLRDEPVELHRVRLKKAARSRRRFLNELTESIFQEEPIFAILKRNK